jgi:AraC-like DNA-binding protein
MEVVLLVGAIQALFFVVLLLNKKGKAVSDKILAVWLTLFAIHFSAVYYMYQQGYIFYIDNGAYISSIIILYYSLMYVYAKSVISKENTFKIKWFIHLIPALISFLSFVPYMSLSFEEKVEYIQQNISSDAYQNLAIALLFFFITFYIIAIFRLLNRHAIYIKKTFSFDENINLRWLKKLAIILVMIWFVISLMMGYIYYIDSISEMLFLESFAKIEMQGHAIFVFFVFLLGFFGIKQQIIYSFPVINAKEKSELVIKEEIIEEITKKKEKVISNRQYQKSGLKKEDAQIYLKQLLLYMEEEKPYLNGKLSLKQIALELNISTNYLSQVINENLEKNFFDFVNEYRVNLVKEKLKLPNNRKYTLLALAYDCGFNSKSSFNAIFKKKTGLTPTQYLKSISDLT